MKRFSVRLKCELLYAALVLIRQDDFMPVTSKYDDKQVERIISDVVNVLEQHGTSTDLSLMVIGNVATNILNHNIPAAQRQAFADKFAQALMASIDSQ
ncbi:hypothetical protein SAMN05444724_0375 [Salinivibrio sp. ES.052]|nr:hypothetical protein SAMN05444724_0375 [Salinivibrio sp. ES.052]